MAIITSADGTDDTVFGTLDLSDVIFGGTGNTSQGQPSGSDVLYGGPETSPGSGVPNEVNTGNDTIHGGAGNDIIYGFDDDDRLIGGDDNDVLYGGFNDDTLFSGDGDDTAFGGNQDDVIQGSNGNDVLYGGSGADEISAGRDDDNVFGGADGDDISGGLGNDTIEGGAGADTLDGGNDDGDIVSFASSSGAVAVDLAAETLIGGDATGDTIERFEGILGSDFNDNLIGNAASNTIIGGDGDDTIEGGEGADTLDGGAGDADIVNYENSNEALAINLDLSTPSGGHANGDVISNFENVRGTDFNDDIRGNGADNTLFGGEGIDGLFGQGGRDELFGGAGNDGLNVGINLSGLVAGEVYDGGDDFDRLEINTFNGGTHDFRNITLVDIERFQIGNAFAGDVVVQFDAAQIQANFDEIDVSTRTDRTRVIEIDMDGVVDFDLSAVTVTGLNASAPNTPSGDGFVINGDSDAETITGSAFRDTILGGLGDDTIEGGGGVDSLDGGEGFDTLSYANATSGLQLNLLQGFGNFGFSAGDTFAGFERFIGSEFDDIILGDVDGVTLIGAGGDDFLSDSDGVDALFGGTGNDRIVVNSIATVGAIFDGGADFDSLNFSDGGIIDLRDDTVTNFEELAFFDAGGVDQTVQLTASQLSGFDVVVALVHTGAFVTEVDLGSATTLDLSAITFAGTFDQPDDGVIVNGDGDGETITSSSIDDTILAAGGDDTVIWANGVGNTDTLDGGTGFDTLSFESATARITLSLDVPGNQFFNLSFGSGFASINEFERFIGSDFNDVFVDSIGSDTIFGGEGGDSFQDNGGSDTFFGGAGNDRFTLEGPNQAVGEFYDGGADFDELHLREGGTFSLRDDTITDVEQLVFFDAGGTGATAQLTAAQAESFDAVLALAHTGAFVTEIEMGSSLSLDLSGTGFGGTFDQPGDRVEITGDGDGETISASNIGDTIEGNGGSDSIAGNAGSDLIFGGLGDDTLEGGAEADAIRGGIGNDTLHGDGGSDILVGAEDNDVLYGGEDHDILEGGAGADAFFGGSGFDVVSHFLATSAIRVDLSGALPGTGDAAGDTYDSIEAISGATGFANTLIGDGEANLLTGGALGDLLEGGFGDDTLDGASGADTLEGGAGSDTYRVDSASDIVTELAGEGIDIVLTEVSLTAAQNVELVSAVNASVQTLTAASTGTWLIGNDIANTLTGGSGNDRLHGEDGDDLLTGLGGNDLHQGGAGADTFVFSSNDGINAIFDFEIGTDLIDISAARQDFNSITLTDTGAGVIVDYDLTSAPGQVLLTGITASQLSASDFIEGVFSTPTPITGTTGAETLRGTDGDDLINGLGGNDLLIGGSGDDTMDGGEGDDRYYVDQVGDVVIEQAEEGYDRVYTTIDVTLGDHIEAGAVRGTDAVAITGNALDNWISGNAADNQFFGLAGNDRLIGRGGDDTLDGGTGNDVLEGKAGADTFIFLADSGTDNILDFEVGIDTLDVSALATSFAQLEVLDIGTSTLVRFDDTPGSIDQVVLAGIDALLITADSFDFVA